MMASTVNVVHGSTTLHISGRLKERFEFLRS